MKHFKKITFITRWLQIIVAVVLTAMMMKAMKLLFFLFKKEGVF